MVERGLRRYASTSSSTSSPRRYRQLISSSIVFFSTHLRLSDTFTPIVSSSTQTTSTIITINNKWAIRRFRDASLLADKSLQRQLQQRHHHHYLYHHHHHHHAWAGLAHPLTAISESFHHRRFHQHCRLLATMESMSGNVSMDSIDSATQTTNNWNDILPMQKGSHQSMQVFVCSDDAADMDVDAFDPATFPNRIKATVTTCRTWGDISSLWVHVPMQRSSLIEMGQMYEMGFRFHHATGDTAVLNLWLHDSQSKIPEYATHNIGVGAVVVNCRNEILCVRERHKNYLPWKTPTGLSELGEPLDVAAVREVWEETGLRTKFHSVLGFRQTHGLAHGRSDLFFVCRLDLIEEVDNDGNIIIPEPIAEASEIETAEWVPLQMYRDMINGVTSEGGHPMMKHVMEVFDAGRHIERRIVNSVIPGREPNAIFYPVAQPETEKT